MVPIDGGVLDHKAFYDNVRNALFGGWISHAQVNGIDGILGAWAELGTSIPRQLSYVLATAHHETGGRMYPIREGFAKNDAQARRIVRHRKYGKPAGPYHHVYYGRGHVQLTWLYNYELSSEDAGVDLVKDPDAMLDPVISAKILVIGMLDGRWNGRAKGLGAYISSNRADYRNARRTVNVTDKWREIKTLSQTYEHALRVALRPEGHVPPPDVPKSDTPPKPKSFVGLILELISKLFRR